MISEEHFQYLSSCHISNRYENATIFSTKTASLVSYDKDFHVHTTLLDHSRRNFGFILLNQVIIEFCYHNFKNGGIGALLICCKLCLCGHCQLCWTRLIEEHTCCGFFPCIDACWYLHAIPCFIHDLCNYYVF